MTETTATAVPPPLSKRRTYRRLLFGSLAVGVVLGVAARLLGYPLVGEAIYWLGILGAGAAYVAAPVGLFDERDTRLEERASALTLTLAAPLLVVAASALRTANVLDLYTAPPALWGALYGVIGVYVLFAISFVVVRLRS